MNYISDFKQFQKEFWELRDQGFSWEKALEILIEKYGEKDGEDDDET